jgi:hypothetical protein
MYNGEDGGGGGSSEMQKYSCILFSCFDRKDVDTSHYVGTTFIFCGTASHFLKIEMYG